MKFSKRVQRPVLLGGLALLLLAAAGVVWMLCRPAAPPPVVTVKRPPPEPILVDDFEVGATSGLFAQRKNRLDAFQGTWARRPSYAVITKVLQNRPGSIGNALRIEFSKVGGWCGWYTLLNGIDVSRHNALTFWVKGEAGGERFDVGMADERMQELEIDAVYVGSIKAFLPEGVTTEWQQVKIPLQGFKSELDLTRMGSLVFWFRYEGAGAIQVDDVAFVYDEEIEKILEANIPRGQMDPKSPRAMWVWKYDPVQNLQVRQELLEFCRRTALSRLYIYLGEEPIPQMPKTYQRQLAEFMKQCHAMGVEVQALQGNPLWALKSHHPRVLEWVSGFLQFNREHPPQERIDGVHMDIEPYLTSEWETGDREKLKEEFLELLAQCRAIIDAYNLAHSPSPASSPPPGEGKGEGKTVARPWGIGPTARFPFVMGLAIPLFYEREPEMEERMLKHLHYAALMDYYDTARDIIEHGRFHVELAERLGIQMVIGVETQDLVQMNQGKRRNTFVEEGWEDMERQLDQVAKTFAGHSSYDGVAIHCYYAYRVLQRGRNVPTRERSGKIPRLTASRAAAGVAIDGELDDWAGAVWVAVDRGEQVVYGAGAWEGPIDLSFRLALQWEPEALLMAMEVTDDVVFQEKQKADMWEGDHFEVWVDVDLEADFTEAVNSSDDFQLGFSPGNFQSLGPEVHVWVPSVSEESLTQVQIAAKQVPADPTTRRLAGYTLEVRLPTAFLFQNVEKKVGVEPAKSPAASRVDPQVLALQEGVLNSGELKAGFRLGLMVDGSDSDEARSPQKCLISTSQQRQWGDPTTFNVLELK